ncbi:MAG TPA: hypothetical protein DCE18_13915 [Syntrophobacteraceae bacterium]|nr:hypothetical protein [Syntrophobacteraceae bacterium]HBZ54613.1 hypothetical protein [Syntrophobacteraceae bacterium]
MMVVRTRIEAKEQPENSHSSRLRGHVIEDWVGVSWEDVSFSLTYTTMPWRAQRCMKSPQPPFCKGGQRRFHTHPGAIPSK